MSEEGAEGSSGTSDKYRSRGLLGEPKPNADVRRPNAGRTAVNPDESSSSPLATDASAHLASVGKALAEYGYLELKQWRRAWLIVCQAADYPESWLRWSDKD